MTSIPKVLFGVLVILTAIEAGRKMNCGKKSKQFKKCWQNGYSPKIFTSCEAKGSAMTGKLEKLCTKIEKVFSQKCNSFGCEESGMNFYLLIRKTVFQLSVKVLQICGESRFIHRITHVM